MEDNKKQNNLVGRNSAVALRILLLLIIPFIIGYIILPHKHIAKGDNLDTPADFKRNFSYAVQYSFNHTQNEDMQIQQINAIFPFAEYLSIYPLVHNENPEVCFEDQGSTITYSNGIQIPAIFNWHIGLGGTKNITLATNSVQCKPVAFNEHFNYSWAAQIPTEYLDGQIKGTALNPATKAYIQYTMDYGFLQGIVMIPAMFLLVWYPITEIIKKIRNGMIT
jgi:hypothetical protein